jgi:translocation and assembly module TamA
MNRVLRLLVLSLSVAACSSGPKPSNGWWQSLDSSEPNPEDEALSCRGVRSGEELDRLAGCWPPDAPPLGFTDVSGLDTMSPVLRDCLLAGLPAVVTEGADNARCRQGLAEVLDRRLYQLGWLKAQVTPAGSTGAGTSSRARLAVQLGQRYRIGELFVSTGPSRHVNSKNVIKKAQKAIPKRRWCTRAALEEIQTRVYDSTKFQQVQVALGDIDDTAARASVIIRIQE